MSISSYPVHRDGTRCTADTWSDDHFGTGPTCTEHGQPATIETEKVDEQPTIVVIGQFTWGKGTTLEEAKRQWKSHGHNLRLSDGYTILTFDEDSEFLGVDGMARYHWVGNAPEVTDVEPRKSQKRGA